MAKQRTLKSIVNATGIAVHSGQKVYLTLRPAPVNTGIVFCRVDCDPAVTIPARVEHVVDTRFSTCIGREGVHISTVEHLMSALSGLGIDNLYVDVSAQEVPVMDGSAAPFVFLIKSAGIEEQNAVKKFIRIKKHIAVVQGDKTAELKPFEGFRVNLGLDYEHPILDDNKRVSFDFSSGSYIREVSRARTFGFLSDYEFLRERKLALGASLDNTVVLDEFKVVNEDGLRYSDECVRHKVLDAIGDLYLLGHSVIGEFVGYKSGHELNNKLLRRLLQEEDAFEIITFEDSETVPLSFIPVLQAS